MGITRPLFVYFWSFQTQILQEKTVGISRIRTRFVGYFINKCYKALQVVPSINYSTP